MRLRRLLVLLLVFQLAVSPTMALEIGGELFVNLNAADFDPSGDVWSNSGSYTDFTKVGNPIRLDVGSHPAVVFNGSSAFMADELTPETIVYGEERTIEAWVFNPNVANEETIVSWGKRGGPDGTNMSFNYGNNPSFGAVGHWGAPDLGWGDGFADTKGAPAPFAWHHLVYTYDQDGFSRVYADGVLANEDNILELIGGLDTYDETAIAIGSQWEGSSNFDNLGDPAQLTGGLRGTLGIGRLRIHDLALTGDQIALNYNEEVGSFENPLIIGDPPKGDPIARALSASPIHRWSFSNAAGDATDAELIDSIGGAHGVVLGDGAEFTGTQLRLPGGASAEAAYGDLPNGLISGLTDVTIEAWTTNESAQNWGRIFDFGSTSPGGEDGEVFGPGGGGTGLDYLELSASRGGNTNDHRLELRDEDPAGGGITTVDFTVVEDLPAEIHYTVVYDSDGIKSRDFVGNVTGEAPVLQVYYNGELVAEGETSLELSNINDVNNWLGRSNWTADANFAGTFDEFRIYDYALDQDEVLGSHEAGPDTLNIGPVTVPGDCNDDSVVDSGDLACVADVAGLDLVLNATGLVPGDLDGQNGVDFADFLKLSGNFGSGGVGYQGGDIDLNGTVEFADFLVLSGNFGLTSAAASAVPEPSSQLLLSMMFGLVLVGLRRRRQR